MKRLILAMIFLNMMGANIVLADSNVLDASNGKVVEDSFYLKLYSVQYVDKYLAEQKAKELVNGQVFQDQDTKRYQILYGNCIVVGAVQINYMTE